MIMLLPSVEQFKHVPERQKYYRLSKYGEILDQIHWKIDMPVLMLFSCLSTSVDVGRSLGSCFQHCSTNCFKVLRLVMSIGRSGLLPSITMKITALSFFFFMERGFSCVYLKNCHS